MQADILNAMAVSDQHVPLAADLTMDLTTQNRLSVNIKENLVHLAKMRGTSVK
jgi:hypothetical protein